MQRTTKGEDEKPDKKLLPSPKKDMVVAQTIYWAAMEVKAYQLCFYPKITVNRIYWWIAFGM